MRFRDQVRPTVHFKKGTSRRKRRLVQDMVEHMWKEYGRRIEEVIEHHSTNLLVYGMSHTKVIWDDDSEAIQFEVTP